MTSIWIENESGKGEKKSVVSTYLAQLPAIVIYLDQAQGIGHQASTINVLRHVIRLGFVGVIHLHWHGELNEEKIATILPGFDSDLGSLKVDGVEVLIQPESSSEVPLAITCGSDGNYINLCKSLGVQAFLKLQPYQWTGTNKSNPAFDVAIFIDGTRVDLREELPLLLERSYYVPAPTNEGPAWDDFASGNDGLLFPTYDDENEVSETYEEDLEEDDFLNEQLDLHKTLSFIFEKIDSGEIDLCPVYGIGDDPSVEWPLPARPEVVLTNLAGGIRAAQPKTGKLAVILVLAALRYKTYKQFTIACLGNINHVSVFDVKNSMYGLVGAFDLLDSDSVMVIPIGNVPMPVFNYVYSRATLPFVFEGKGTANLAVNLGLPFFYLKSRFEKGMLYPAVPIGSSVDFRVAYCDQAAAQLLLKSNETTWNAIAEFIVRSRDGDDELFRYFSQDIPGALHDEEDKLVWAIWYLLRKREAAVSIGSTLNTLALQATLTVSNNNNEST
jgi:hypothetical protein